jgi:LysM repeat protein
LTLGPGLRYNRSRTEGRALIPFPNNSSQARATDESDLLQTQRRRRDGHDSERSTSGRRVRRRRRSTPWLQRNALSVAAVSILIAFLGLGFGLLQMINRPEPTPALLAIAAPEASTAANIVGNSTSASVLSGASVGAPVPVVAQGGSSASSADAPRAIQSNVKTLQANYTIAAGDTLVQIALRFNTTVDRIQAFNNLSDPRALRIGTRLVIPPPL